jgi:hypothetical protein
MKYAVEVGWGPVVHSKFHKDWLRHSEVVGGGDVPSKLRARFLAAAVALTLTFTGLICSQFELLKIKLEKHYNFLLFLEACKFNVCYWPFSKIAALPSPPHGPG